MTWPCMRWWMKRWRTRSTSIGARDARNCPKPTAAGALGNLPHVKTGDFVMRRYYTRLSRKTRLMLLALVAAGIVWFGYSRFGSSREPHAQHPAALLLQSLAAASEYQIRDAKVLDDGNQVVADGPVKPDAPGKVDALDIRKAYERASRLAAQTKGKVFKATITPHWF